MGSVHYFSPEQARGAYVDERSDIYSLGIVLYEMLTGKVPFDGDNPITIALMHINEPMPSVTAQVPGIPPQLEKIIMKATEKYQSNRYRTADEMIEDLDNIEFITKVISKITLVGALFLGLVATLPILLTAITGMNISLGGTSILIVVGVALDTSRSLESYMLMRHHKGFLE